MSPLYTSELYRSCGAPLAGVPEIEAWGTLEGGDSTTATLKLGLFGYDITCLAVNCAEGSGDYYPYCDLIKARGLDGLAFGIKWELDLAATKFYWVGFHSETGRDFMVGVEDNPTIWT